MANFYTSSEQLIGKTPILRLKNFEKKYNVNSKIFAKLEFFNIAGSVKDRVGREMIADAEEKGILRKGSVIIEPTSGNTGIGIAAVAAVRGYRTIIVMPETMSEERKKLMLAYGAELVLTDGLRGMTGAIEKAEELKREIPESVILGQFYNPANSLAHFKTTGPEIYEDMDGAVDVFISAVGTGGTVTGVGEYLKSRNPNVKIVAVEPSASAVLSGRKAGKHSIQGIGAGFIPKVLKCEIIDEIITVDDEEAFEISRYLGKTEGFLAGISSGAALAAAVKLSKKEEFSDKNIVVLLPDSGEKYLSTTLYQF